MGFGMFLGVDLGTTRTRISSRDRGILLDIPTAVAIQSATSEIIAIGESAYELVGRTPTSIQVIKPITNGVISDSALMQVLLKKCFQEVLEGFLARYFRPTVVVAVPGSITDVEKQAVYDTLKRAGAKQVFAIRSSLAAALGAGINITQVGGHMVVVLGGGTTEIAVISMREPTSEVSLKIGGDQLDEDIVRFIRTEYNLSIGLQTANRIKHEIGTAYPSSSFSSSMSVSGLDVSSNKPSQVAVKSADIFKAMEPNLLSILEGVSDSFINTPPELMSDIKQNGIVLTGGGANLRSLSQLLSEKMGVPVRPANNPADCVALGTAQALSLLDQLFT